VQEKQGAVAHPLLLLATCLLPLCKTGKVVYDTQLTEIAVIATDMAASQPTGQPSVLMYFSSALSSFCGDFTFMIVTSC
jgi:hypothetical protein